MLTQRPGLRSLFRSLHSPQNRYQQQYWKPSDESRSLGENLSDETVNCTTEGGGYEIPRRQ
jgi:hypothetical protein